MSESKRHLVVLAGDEGGRTPVFFRPMIQYALDAAERAGAPSPAVAAGEEAALRGLAAAAHAASGSACTEARAEGVPEPAARCFRAGDMAEALRRGARGFAEAARALGAAEYRLLDPDEALRAGVYYGLCRVEAVMRRRHNAALARAGVDLREPSTTLIDPGPYASLRPGSRLRDGAGLGTFAELRTAGRAFTSGRA